MDVDNLLAGHRIDEELTKALNACDVLVVSTFRTGWIGRWSGTSTPARSSRHNHSF